jgi:hypothetical protein
MRLLTLLGLQNLMLAAATGRRKRLLTAETSNDILE